MVTATVTTGLVAGIGVFALAGEGGQHANGEAPIQTALAAQADVAAKESGSGRFRATKLPAGFKLLKEEDVVLSDRTADGGSTKVPGMTLHVLEFTTNTAEERKRIADAGGDLGPSIVVAINAKSGNKPSDADKLWAGEKRVELRNRSGAVLKRASEGDQAKSAGLKTAYAARWTERSNIDIQVTGSGVSEEDVLLVSRNLTED